MSSVLKKADKLNLSLSLLTFGCKVLYTPSPNLQQMTDEYLLITEE